MGGLPGLAIRRPVTTAMAFLALGLLGFLSYRQLPLQLLPNYTYPRVWVQAYWNGATPDAVERDVLRVVEGELAALGSVKELISTARAGGGTVEVAFDRGVDLDFAAVRIEQQLARAGEKLPERVFLDVQRFDTSSFSNFVMVLSFRGDVDMEAMRTLADDVVVPVLSGVDGVVQVAVQGGAAKQIGVFLNPDQARARGVSVAAVQQALGSATRPVTAVGDVVDGGRRLPVVLDGRARRLADVADAVVGSDSRVRVSHVADVIPGIASNVERYRVNGQTSVALYVFKDQQSNLIGVAQRLRSRVDEFNAEHAADGLSLGVDFDAAKVMERELTKLQERAGSGALLAMLVLLVFLGARPGTVVAFAVPTLGVVVAVVGFGHRSPDESLGWLLWAALGAVAVLLAWRRDSRAVGVVALAVPCSLLVAFCLFRWAGLSINVLSLLGLALAVGMLLDNGIVVLESIAARRQRRGDRIDAASRGASQVQRAVMAGTLTTLVVFVPLFMVDSEYTPLFRELALSVSFPLIASLLVALTLVPMLASRLSEPPVPAPAARLPVPHGPARPSRAAAWYSAILRVALRNPVFTVVFFFALVVVSLAPAGLIVAAFSSSERPAEDRIEIEAKLPEGTPIESVDEIAKQVEGLTSDLPELDEVRTSVREGEARVSVVFKDPEDRDVGVSIARARERLRKQTAQIPGKDLEIQVDPPSADGGGGGGGAGGLLGGGGNRETVRVSGPEGSALTDLATRFREALETVPGVTRVTSDLAQPRPTIEVHPDRERLADVGLSAAELMGVIWAARREGEPTRFPFRLGDEDIDLVLWVEGGDTRTVDEVRRFPLVTHSGARVPLGDVSLVTTGSEPPEFKRYQRARTVTLQYDFDQRTAGSGAAVETVRDAVDRLAASFAPPPGFAIEVEHADSGLSEQKKMIYLGVGLVYVVLAIAFESLLLPLLILPCVLLALIGVVWALALTGTGLDQYVMLGGIVLLGIVVNNGILFVDRSQALIAAGVRRPTAVLRAAHDRLRPVLMTTATTVLGLLPLAVSTGGQQEIWPPFGRAVIGGLVASTAISLVFVPAGTLVFGRLQDMFTRLGWPLSVAGLAAGVAVLVGLDRSELVTNELLLWALAPVLLIGIPGFLRAVQWSWRGEGQRDLVADEGPVEVRVRNARKVYGGPARVLANARVVDRWVELARRHGLGPRDVDPPAAGRARLAWQLGLATLVVVLHVLAESTWGLFLLSVPALLLLDGILDGALTALGRPGAWPPARWWGRLWRVVEALGLWGYLWWRHRPDSTADDVTLVFAGLLLGAWAVLHLVGLGGFVGALRRVLTPEPVTALAGVDLSFGVGLHGLLGPNGAGKSTLMRLVVNLYRPTRGTVTVNGHDLLSNAASLQSRIGYLPQFFGVPPRLTAREYLHHQALLAGRTDAARRAELVDSVLREVGLADRADERLGGYSGGMRQRVGIARTLLNLPRIVVVDEPTVGLDPRERIRFRNLLAELARTRVVLLSTHVVEDIGSACQDVVVLDHGRVLFRGAPSELVARAEGKSWVVDVPESALADVGKRFRVVATTRLPGGQVRLRGVGRAPDGAEATQPSLEDAYLLLLGRLPEGNDRAA